MKKLICFLFIVLLSKTSFSQLKPSYDQYILNNYLLNPAVTGIENYTDVKSSFRNQWVGIQGAPVTYSFSIHTPIGKADTRITPTSFHLVGYDPINDYNVENNTIIEPYHGVGLSFINDKAGYINRWTLSASYAYHTPITSNTILSGGINLGLSRIDLDRGKINLGDPNQYDPSIGYNFDELTKFKFESGVGLWLHNTKYYIGLSALNIVLGANKFTNFNSYGNPFTPNFFFTTGYRHYFKNDLSITPSLMFQYQKDGLTDTHLSCKLQYLDKIWIGGSYKISNLINAYSGLVGLNISKAFQISYSYEIAAESRLSSYTNNTHEILLGFILGNYSKY